MGEWEWAYEAGAYVVRRRSDKHLAWAFQEQDYAIQLCKNLNAIPPTHETCDAPEIHLLLRAYKQLKRYNDIPMVAEIEQFIADLPAAPKAGEQQT